MDGCRFPSGRPGFVRPRLRYELVDGVIVSHAAPAPTHGAILASLASALLPRLRGQPGGCRPEIGSGAAPVHQQNPTARIPDATIRCGDTPRVVFEIVSPSEIRAWRARDRKRCDLMDVDGVAEIVEIYQDDAAVHVFRRAADDTWSFEAVGGLDASLPLRSVGISIPLAELYEFAPPDEPTTGQPG